MGQRKPRTRGNGRYTESGFWQFIRAGLRNKYNKWGPKWDVLNDAKRKSKSGNKRLKWEYQCSLCSQWFPQKEVEIDHIEPCGQLKSYDDLPGFVARLFCEKEGLRVVCKPCHRNRNDGRN